MYCVELDPWILGTLTERAIFFGWKIVMFVFKSVADECSEPRVRHNVSTIVLLMCLQVRLISFFPKCDLLAGKSEQSQVISFKETLRIVRTLSSLGILKTFERLKSGRTIFMVSGYFMDVSRPNGPELSCGGEQPPHGSLLRGRSDHRR
jgi:hypothetical protein